MRILNWIKQKAMPMSKYPEWLRKKGAIIGSNCEIYKSASFGSEPYLISIGDHVRINANVTFSTHDGGCWVLRDSRAGFGTRYKNADLFGRINIGNNVHIAHNVTILPGVTIGDNCIIGCGAVVTKDIPENSVAVGVPAKVIETIEEYAQKMEGRYINTKHLSYDEKKHILMDVFDIDNNIL